MKEIQTYIKQLFLSGQNDLQSRDVDKEKVRQSLIQIFTDRGPLFLADILLSARHRPAL